MILAVPINSKGEIIGDAKRFSDEHFNRMKKTFLKNFAWKVVEKEKSVETTELIPVSTKNAKSKVDEVIEIPLELNKKPRKNKYEK